MTAKRKKRAAGGIVCLVVAALAMGWFVGRYIPSVPHGPASLLYAGMYDGNGEPSQRVVDCEFGRSAALEGIVQGMAFIWETDRPTASIGETNETIPSDEYIEHLKSIGDWEYEYPLFEMRIDEVRSVSGSAFKELYPEYSNQEVYPEDSTMVLVSATVTNTSNTLIAGSVGPYSSDGLPKFRLWTDAWTSAYAETIYAEDGTLVVEAGPLSDGTMRAGVRLDAYAFSMLAEYTSLDDPPSDDIQTAPVNVKPGETQTVVLPFIVPNEALKTDGTSRHIDFSKYCIQTVDHRTETTYRLWLE